MFNTEILHDGHDIISAQFEQDQLPEYALTVKRGRVGACKGFWCNLVKLVLLATGNMYEVDSNIHFTLVLKPSTC